QPTQDEGHLRRSLQLRHCSTRSGQIAYFAGGLGVAVRRRLWHKAGRYRPCLVLPPQFTSSAIRLLAALKPRKETEKVMSLPPSATVAILSWPPWTRALTKSDPKLRGTRHPLGTHVLNRRFSPAAPLSICRVTPLSSRIPKGSISAPPIPASVLRNSMASTRCPVSRLVCCWIMLHTLASPLIAQLTCQSL